MILFFAKRKKESTSKRGSLKKMLRKILIKMLKPYYTNPNYGKLSDHVKSLNESVTFEEVAIVHKSIQETQNECKHVGFTYKEVWTQKYEHNKIQIAETKERLDTWVDSWRTSDIFCCCYVTIALCNGFSLWI